MSFPRAAKASVRKPRTPLIIVAIILITTIGTVVALVAFTQTIPTVTVPAQPLLASNCSALLQEGTINPVSGVLLVDCGTVNGVVTSAFTASNGPFKATPTFTIPTTPNTITTSLDLTTTGSCTGTLTALTSATQLTLSNGQYDYCLGYSGVPTSGGTIGPVSIQWSVP